ncbi:MAG: GNAT family N-acetyltransferase [Candidatus Bathyarchaeia archaeon]
MSQSFNLEFHPLVPDRWNDLEKLFGPKGACSGCWCMWWRLPNKTFIQQKGVGNKAALKRIVDAQEEVGILAYSNGEPVGWCSLGPRESFPRLARSRVLRPVDEKPVWSVVCFFVAKPFRHRGVTVALLNAAADHARDRGAGTLEGYPMDPLKGKTADIFAYTGLLSAFRDAGFVEVARRSKTRPIVRRSLMEDATR